METFSTRFKWKNHNDTRPNPFNGQYITALKRIPTIGEHVCFDGANQYEVIDVITELRGWDDFYTIVIN